MKKEIIMLFITLVATSIGYSIIAPLFPQIALKKKVSEFVIGLIISSYAIATVATIPIIPNLIKIYGRINLLYFSLFIEVKRNYKHFKLNNETLYFNNEF